jgi:hypothetical protein
MGSQARSCNGWNAGLEGAEPRFCSFDSKGIGAAARLNIGIGGYGSPLKAGTRRVLFADSIFTAVIVRLDRTISTRRPAVPAIARAFAAFQRRDFSTAIDEIEQVFSERERICGSRAQIDLVGFTLLKAYLAMGRLDDIHRLRDAWRPSPRAIPVAGLDAARVN